MGMLILLKHQQYFQDYLFCGRGTGTDNPPDQPNQGQGRKAGLDHTVRAYSSLENYAAIRSELRGAHFIDCIHQVFLKHATKENVDELLKRVNLKKEYCIVILPPLFR